MLGSGSGGGRRGCLTASGRVDPEKLCWLFARLAAEEEATFQQREVSGVGDGWVLVMGWVKQRVHCHQPGIHSTWHSLA